MSVQGERKGEGRFWATAAFAVVIVVALAMRQHEPRPLAESAPADEFSAARARAVLTEILAGEEPHPVGTRANDRVRQRVVDAFASLGMEASSHDTLVCGSFANCAFVRNLVAEIPGRVDRPAVLLNAHYDSVAAAPGAADDGAGVAVLLEVARALKNGPPPERTIRFLVDDGEEAGLFGAEAWVRDRPVDETLAVVVLEARGTSGPALLFETHPGNIGLVRAYARAAKNPATSSVYFSVYERLPNRTNFTVFKREGYKGMAVAFIENPAHYHTPLDDLERLSDASLQHMGELALAMARELAANGLGNSAGNASYFDLAGTTVVFWPEAWNAWMAIAALLLVAVVGVAAWKRGVASPGEILAGWFLVFVVVGVSGGLGWLMLRLGVARGGEAGWLANGWLLVFAAWLVALAVVTIPFTFVRRPPAVLSIWTAVWLVNGIAAVVLARLLPGAAYLFSVPALAAGLSGAISMMGGRRNRVEGMLVVPFAVSLLLVVPLIHFLYTGLGLVALPAVAGFAALVLAPLLAVSAEARRTGMLTVGTVGGVLIAIVAFALTPVFSANVPRGLNVVAAQDGAGASSLLLLGTADPIPPAIGAAADWSKQPAEILRRPGAERVPVVWTAQVDQPGLETPQVRGSFASSDDGEVLLLHVRPVGPDSVIRVLLPGEARVVELQRGDEALDLSDRSWSRLLLRGVPEEGVRVTARVPPEGEVTVVEERYALPAAAGAIAGLRTGSEVPIGPGDRTMVTVTRTLADLRAGSIEEVLTPDSDRP